MPIKFTSNQIGFILYACMCFSISPLYPVERCVYATRFSFCFFHSIQNQFSPPSIFHMYGLLVVENPFMVKLLFKWCCRCNHNNNKHTNNQHLSNEATVRKFQNFRMWRVLRRIQPVCVCLICC